jgi:hypothetical protein
MKRLALLLGLLFTASYMPTLSAAGIEDTHYCACSNGSLEGINCNARCALSFAGDWLGKVIIDEYGVQCVCKRKTLDTVECNNKCKKSGNWFYIYSAAKAQKSENPSEGFFRMPPHGEKLVDDNGVISKYTEKK